MGSDKTNETNARLVLPLCFLSLHVSKTLTSQYGTTWNRKWAYTPAAGALLE